LISLCVTLHQPHAQARLAAAAAAAGVIHTPETPSHTFPAGARLRGRGCSAVVALLLLLLLFLLLLLLLLLLAPAAAAATTAREVRAGFAAALLPSLPPSASACTKRAGTRCSRPPRTYLTSYSAPPASPSAASSASSASSASADACRRVTRAAPPGLLLPGSSRASTVTVAPTSKGMLLRFKIAL
jgi:hypothetical protein